MPLACLLIDTDVAVRTQAFTEGLKRCGFQIVTRPRSKPGDILIIWNRGRSREELARRYEKDGCAVLVSENGWIGKDENNHLLYALCRNHHNGAGTWEVGEDDRWAGLGLKLHHWRSSGRHILVLPQRGFGEPGVAMPKNWPASIVQRLKAVTDRPIRVREHPGLNKKPFRPDLEDCWAAVTWGSGAAIKALVAGIPVFHEFPQWIGAGAARLGIADIENPFLDDRLPMLRRLAYAQWRCSELITGEPFARLLK